MSTGADDDTSGKVTIRQAYQGIDRLPMEQDGGFDMAAGLADLRARIDQQEGSDQQRTSLETG